MLKVNLKINLGPKVSNHPIAALQYLTMEKKRSENLQIIEIHTSKRGFLKS